ncbi:hypothetical protein BgiMline_035088 [Biomphalaria glabrata]|uniref:Uncharacterized protein LOC106051494 n=1 Tax=Biomphalaria glabrata TaxID=6526 RepID=A0A9U8DV23_BIOGL|nr:uncharacterized protein LOC106051494 [Biomphalaria glabrata]XP_013062133.2 uncharacterized protein LOC106051494 [Biomphalaria glabrata]XP_055871490.1 uncharacterized protein LOC106051494 [Biomphalaria glabrata]XP_055871491.1 uncharacterized protein LOC106051494 [Biomphalaria glabrata]KAI8736815.1 hypothetical protein BgiMline_025969 [Biomphalaria glabrata]
MNSLVALSELQAAKKEKLQKKSQCEEIKGQLIKISQLQEKKKLLASRLVLLSQGVNAADIYAGPDPRVRELYNNLWDLKEKLSAYRIIGPCGITVVEKTTDQLVVSFTSMWLHVTEAFTLRVKVSESRLKVASTTIPYFIDVQSLLEHSKHLSLSQQMDNIGHKINAYIRRKGELDFVKKELESFLTVCESDEAVTNVELTLNKVCQNDKKMFIYIIYPTMDSLLPETVKIAIGNLDDTLDQGVITDLGTQLKEQPLSIALSTFVPFLT